VTKWVLDRTVDLVARRHSVANDLDKVTVRGDEAGSPEAADALWERVESLYRTGMHPGIQVCIRHKGDVVLNRAIGHARGVRPGHRFDPDQAVPMELDTPINLFSAAKAVTGMVMHKLEEMGALSLDDRVSDYVPDFAEHGKGDITLHQVLSHRAGIPTLPREAFDLDNLTDPDWMEGMLCDLKPSGVVGGSPAYHAVVGGFVMEVVVQHATGRSLRDVLDEEIRQPLGLEWLNYGVDPEDVDLVAHNVETGFPLILPLEMMMRRALGTRWGHVLHLSNDPRFLAAVIPSGNAITTARDIAAFYQCLLNGGELDGPRVFEEETITDALEHRDEGTPIDRMLAVPMRYSSGFMLGNEQVSLYGYDHPRAFGHVGMSNLFTWADPDRELVVALLTTGKPVLGTHLVALPQLIGDIHKAFPES
jgi:CubicO group peptidase (beta-lactamase class C family)